MANDVSATPDRQELVERFANDYRLGTAAVVRGIERAVCGCDYGGTSWTTRDEAQRLGELLSLAPGVRLLEIGAGIEHIERARRLNPYMGGFELWTLGQAFFGAKRYEEAIDAFSQVTDPPTTHFLDLASAYAYLGRDSDARSAMNEFLNRAKDELNPFPGDDRRAWQQYLEWAYARRRKVDFEHIVEGARRAGLPL